MGSILFRKWGSRSGFMKKAVTIPQRGFFQVSKEIQEAVKHKQPVVALETTIYTHGFPYPDNVALARSLESLVRQNGAIPATIGVLNGVSRVGFSAEELDELTATAGNPETKKISRRDLGYICGLGFSGRKLNGGTTVAGTMILARLAGIEIFATGGLGGVHRGGENSMDISADLTELGRTPVAVISSGCKSFLDIPRTLEFLETQGVCVGTFSDGRKGDVEFPAFWTRESGIPSPLTIKDEKEAAAVIYAQSSLGLQSGIHFANPISERYSILKDKIDVIITQALEEAKTLGITGNNNTPFILNKIRELTQGDTIAANRSLVEGNVVRGAKVAVELTKLYSAVQNQCLPVSTTSVNGTNRIPLSAYRASLAKSQTSVVVDHTDVVVAGALAMDLSCDFAPFEDTTVSIDPQLHTSNPANITRSLGGVAQNIATTLHYLGSSVRLCSMIADDADGSAVLGMLTSRGMSVEGIEKMKNGLRTAQYVAFNNAQKNLVLAMADMKILEARSDFGALWQPHLNICKPKWLVVDANWNESTLHKWITAGKAFGVKIAYEPVSAAKSKRLFAPKDKSGHILDVFPHQALSLATPNRIELDSMHSAAQKGDFFNREDWKRTISAMRISNPGLHDRLTAISNTFPAEEGLLKQSIELLPFIPSIVTKLGEEGVLVTLLLQQGDDRLKCPRSAPYILSRSNQDSNIGGMYMRFFPPTERVPKDQILSVNGVGDTFLGVLINGLVKNQSIEAIIDIAQKGSVLTLKSKEAVSPDIAILAQFDHHQQSTKSRTKKRRTHELL